MSTNDHTTKTRRPAEEMNTNPTPMQRDGIIFALGYMDRLNIIMEYMKMMDERNRAINFIQKTGHGDAFAAYCERHSISKT